MTGRRFVASGGPHSLDELASATGCRLADSDQGARRVSDVASLQEAGPDHIAFFDNPRYRQALARTRAGAVILSPAHAALAPPDAACLLSDRPYRSFALVAGILHPEPAPTPGVHPRAVVDPRAQLASDASIGPGAVIEPGAVIGARSAVGANAVIGPDVRIGADCRIGAAASLFHCRLGDRVRIYAGARIGQDGFGFAPDPERHVRMPQLGLVVIGHDCEIGANTTIDRGSLGDTVIESNVWIDNLVQIGHNVRIGRGAVVVAQVGIAGSSQVGPGAQLGGQVGVAGHLTIGAGARIAAQSGVSTNVPAGETWFGSPAQPSLRSFREIALLRRLARKREDRK